MASSRKGIGYKPTAGDILAGKSSIYAQHIMPQKTGPNGSMVSGGQIGDLAKAGGTQDRISGMQRQKLMSQMAYGDRPDQAQLNRRMFLNAAGTEGLESANAAAILKSERENALYDLAARDVNRDEIKRGARRQKTGANIGAVASGAAAAAATFMSDSREKENVRDASGISKSVLSVLTPYGYNYKNDQSLEKWSGVMAQDLEKSEHGKMIVESGADGQKQINSSKALSLILATLADIHKRLERAGL